ncbi:hypothetical protein BKA83DRAFT_26059 [Pisolithus microcarpus]|nr:hypothetical protein BKA83DRAFT_26059 [Pisolithus microcarpus]
MKGPAHSETENKAGKSNCSADTEEDLFHCSRKRSPQDLLHIGRDDWGYVEGMIFMTWPPTNGTRRFSLEVSEDRSISRFAVSFSGRSFPLVKTLPFRPHDRICLALKGVEVEARKESSAPHLLPLTLRYTNDIAIKYLSGINEGKIINTWQGHALVDDWYNPGPMRRVSDVIMDDASASAMPPPLLSLRNVDRPTIQPLEDQLQPSDSCASSRHRDSAFSANRVDGAKLAKLEKAKLRRKSKKLHASRISAHAEHDISKHTNSNGGVSKHIAPPQPPRHAASVHTNSEVNDKTMPTFPEDNGSVQPMSDTKKLRTDTHAGESGLSIGNAFRTEMGDLFTPLNALRRGHEMINVIGVVLQANAPRRTSTNEWSRSFTVVDPSIASGNGFSAVGVGVTCFQKTYVEWLPQVAEGDVVILRKLKISEFNGMLKAIGYADKLRWAVYDSAANNARPVNRGQAPEEEAIGNGLGYVFTPFWKPSKDGVELQYCRILLTWWKGLRGTEKEVICAQHAIRPSKEHRLLSEASPEVVPDGFFNCTVEILHKFANDCGSCTVYVTDYTSNPHTYPLKPAWCPPGLCDLIFPIEMWDAAKEMVHLMNVGEYWYLYNVRARLGRGGYLEGKMQEASKVTQLNETQLDKFPHLGALLKRKRGFSEGGLSAGLPNSFPYKLFQDVDDTSTFFSCAVEILSVDNDARDGTSIYATDYTYNPSFPRQASIAEWARGLDFRVVRIKLDDAQSQVARDTSVGSFYRILNLRMIRRGDGSDTHGRLGGEDRLILPLTEQQAEQHTTLKMNKDKWKRELMLDRTTWATSPTPQPTANQCESTGYSTIQQVLSDTTCPSTSTVVARAVDFYPFILEDACILRCMKCQADVPLSFKACPSCDDMLETHCKWCYCLYLRLEDDAGDNLNVSLCGEECTLLQDTPADDLHYDRGAFHKFFAKLKPVIGNLVEVHNAWSVNREKVVESPHMRFTIESWAIGDDERGYGLLSCTPA